MPIRQIFTLTTCTLLSSQRLPTSPKSREKHTVSAVKEQGEEESKNEEEKIIIFLLGLSIEQLHSQRTSCWRRHGAKRRNAVDTGAHTTQGIWIPVGLTFVNEGIGYCAITGHVHNEEGSWYQRLRSRSQM